MSGLFLLTENMVRGLDQDETNFLHEVSRQQCLLEKKTRDEEMQELLEYRISFDVIRRGFFVVLLLRIYFIQYLCWVKEAELDVTILCVNEFKEDQTNNFY